ncbi:acyl-CoA-binding domain-containing protein 6-like [Euwallacea similis]|uniref:acyl-CoA-binding domain-containing protein 6-like n=1 Tax=Euwallacea similis TaxID=1736056 RepID=UPI00344E2A69
MATATGDDFSDLIELGIEVGAEDELTVKFNKCARHVQVISGSLSEHTLLQLYGFYKQALEGPCNAPKPSWYDLKGKAKWEAWKSLGELERNEAKNRYIEQVFNADPEFSFDLKRDKGESWSVGVSSLIDHQILSSEKDLLDYIREGDLTKVKCLLSQLKESKNFIYQDGMSLIHYAADVGNVELLDLLINEGCDMNLQDSEGQTALHYASSCGHAECVLLLLSKGAVFDVKDTDGYTALDVASDNAIKMLFSKQPEKVAI